MSHRSTRRQFIKRTTAGGLGLWVAAGHMPSLADSPNGKLNIAIVGVGGMGRSHVDDDEVKKENVVALCDIDDNELGSAAKVHPKAAKYNDFREMFDKEKSIDAVICATPDHCHAVVTAMALRLGKHAYTQKPLTHTVYEAHVISKLAAENPKLATQMGNQGHSNGGARRVVELVRAGVVGPIREVHAWTDRPIWPQGIGRPAQSQTPPKHVHWDLWLGPMPYRPYHEKTYHRFNWRGFWDFGTGALGDMACHVADTAFWALDLRAPTSIEAVSEGATSETGPKWEIITYQFPERNGRPPVKFTWYDGHKFPPQELVSRYGITQTVDEEIKDDDADKGAAKKEGEKAETKRRRRRTRSVTKPGYQDNGSLLHRRQGRHLSAGRLWRQLQAAPRQGLGRVQAPAPNDRQFAGPHARLDRGRQERHPALLQLRLRLRAHRHGPARQPGDPVRSANRVGRRQPPRDQLPRSREVHPARVP
jgi:predicted dehydrogenase